MSAKKEKNLKNYEMIMALKPLLPDDLRKEIHKDFVELIKSKGGELIDVDVWGKRYLSYKIQGHNEGYYIVYTFSLSASEIAEVRRLMQLKLEILRFMIVDMEHMDIQSKGIKKKELDI